MYLWDLNCANYLSNLSKKHQLPPFGCFDAKINDNFILAYKKLADQAERIIKTADSENFLNQIHQLLDIDMRLYYYLLLMIYNDGFRSEEQMLQELEHNYKSEYFSDDEHFYPFSDYRLIVEHP
ncbi:hypothetical protein [Enterococcus pingfangensis]|uniref:hypothetical protein n=1 Tax=Enterococcus pingfangensis TaxID=2559924 RepID=UPI0010F94AE6|nr:hypothetical protein [Enterococcus pingfangensis]